MNKIILVFWKRTDFFVFKSLSLAWSFLAFQDITKSAGDSSSVSLLSLC